MNPDVDYANLYRDFYSKLKSKIFRRPNVIEAKDDFALLEKTLDTEETPEYAAVFALGKAKCEAQSNNAVGEACALLDAGRHFLRAEDHLRLINAFSLRENLDCFVSCNLKAAKIYETNELLTLAATVYIYTGDSLMKYESFDEAIPILSRAADIFCRDAPRSLQILNKCASCQLLLRDYSGALTTFLRMQKSITDAHETHDYEMEFFVDDIISSEIFRVLLILISVPSNIRIDSDLQKLHSLKAYLEVEHNGGVDSNAQYLDKDLFLFLQSLIIAHRSGNIADFEYSASFLQKRVTLIQRKLVCDILDEMIHPAGSLH